MQEKTGQFGFAFSGPRKYTRLSPAFVARVPQDDLTSAKNVVVEESALTSDTVYDKDSVEPRLAINIKSPCPVPEAGIQRCREVMESGRMFRYGGLTPGANNPDQTVDDVSLVEKSFADVTGHKYCVALNSCGSAIFLAVFAVLKKEHERLSKIPGPTKILTNAFTFAAVPSAIVHAGCEPEYVNCTDQFVIDVEDFERKAKESGAKIAIVSHMRGRLCDMSGVAEVCKKYDITLIEDCAHSLGCDWKGVKSGSSEHGTVAACFSAQSNKLINSGEGGFLVTDDEEVAVRANNDWNRNSNLGLVVGATRPEELAEIREICGEMMLLLPGVGAQGADVAELMRAGQGGGMLISSSRAILYAGDDDEFADAARTVAEATRDEINRHKRI